MFTSKPHGPFVQTRPMVCDFCQGVCGCMAMPGIAVVAPLVTAEYVCYVICASCAGYINGPHGRIVDGNY